jgi:hypothetical protein
MDEHQDIADALETEPVVRVNRELTLLPQHFGEDLKISKTRLLLDHRFQLVHYLDARGLQEKIAGGAAEIAHVLERARYVVKSRSTSA